MCRNITTLRGLEPPATPEEIEAAARQYVRKVSGITHPATATEAAFEHAVAAIADVTAGVLRDLPPRRRPPKAIPPLRRPGVRARQAGQGSRALSEVQPALTCSLPGRSVPASDAAAR
jgi:hypothetical protein